MKINSIDTLGSLGSLKWSLKQNGETILNQGFGIIIDKDLSFVLEVSGLSMYETFVIIKQWRDTIKIKDISVNLEDESYKNMSCGEYSDAVDKFDNLAKSLHIQMSTDNIEKMILPMSNYVFTLLIPISFISVLNTINEEEYIACFNYNKENQTHTINWDALIVDHGSVYNHISRNVIDRLSNVGPYTLEYRDILQTTMFNKITRSTHEPFAKILHSIEYSTNDENLNKKIVFGFDDTSEFMDHMQHITKLWARTKFEYIVKMPYSAWVHILSLVKFPIGFFSDMITNVNITADDCNNNNDHKAGTVDYKYKNRLQQYHDYALNLYTDLSETIKPLKNIDSSVTGYSDIHNLTYRELYSLMPASTSCIASIIVTWEDIQDIENLMRHLEQPVIDIFSEIKHDIKQIKQE